MTIDSFVSSATETYHFLSDFQSSLMNFLLWNTVPNRELFILVCPPEHQKLVEITEMASMISNVP